MNARQLRDGLVAHSGHLLVVRLFRRMIAIGGYDRAVALAGQAFMSLLPTLLVLGATLPAWARTSTGGAVVAGLGLSSSAASALTDLLAPVDAGPPEAEPLLVVSGVLLVISVLGFTRTLQRTHLAAWELPSSGIRGWGHSVVAAAALVGEFVLIALLGPVLTHLLSSLPLGLLGHALIATVLWWPVQHLLLGGRVAWRPLLPGSVATGVGQAVVIGLSGVYVPAVVTREAGRYGAVGAAVALVSWLVVLGMLLVVAAVLGAELARTDAGGRLPSRMPPGDDVSPAER